MKDLFEGVYLKHQKNGESICFIAGRAGETRFVQVLSLIHISPESAAVLRRS